MQNLKNFIIAFAVGLVMFSVLAAMIPRLLVQDNAKQPDSPGADTVDSDGEQTDTADSAPVIGGKTFTAVVGGYDADTGELDGLLFLKADKENKRFIVAAIPTALNVVVTSTDPATGTTVKTNVRMKDFPLRYRDSEKNQRIVDTVHALTGMEIDYYAFFKTSAALSLFEKTGGLYYTVPQDMVYVGTGSESNPEISLRAGGQVLNSKQILGLLRFSVYSTDERRNNARRAAVQADFVSEALKQLLALDAQTLLEGVTGVLAGCETNFTAADFRENFELISKFGEYSAASVVMTVDLADPLEYTYSQKLFENYK